MDGKELKQSVIADLESLKSLDIEVIPAKIYYPAILKLAFNGIWKLGVVVFLSIAYSSFFHPTHHPIVGQGDYAEIIIWSVIAAFFMSLGAMLLFLQPMIQYYLIKYHLMNQLKTGHFLVKKLKQCAYLFLCIFTLLCALFASYTESADIFLMIGLSFMASVFLTYAVISMEMNRVGISLLFTGINQFFNKEKTA